MAISQIHPFGTRAAFVFLALGLLWSTAAAQGDDKAGKKGGDVRKDGDDKTGKKKGEDVAKEDVPKHKAQYAQEYEHSFKTDKELDPLFHWHGEEPQGCVEFDPTGLLLHLPDGHAGKRMGTGVGINTPIKGDFEVTLRYDMIKEPTLADTGEGTGIFLWVDLNKKGLNRGYLTRVVRPSKQYGIWYHLTPEEGKKPINITRNFPTNDSSGRMRIVRTGATLYYYVSEGANGDFKLLYRHAFPADEVQAVRWGGTTGGPKASLEARFVDLNIRADELPDLPKNKVAEPGKRDEGQDNAAPARRNLVWLIVVLVIGGVLVVAVAFVGGLVLYLRRKA